MRETLAACMLLLLCATPLLAAGFDTPSLSAPLAASHFFDPDRLLTTAGVKYSAADDLTLEPEWGLGYRALEREIPGGIEESTHLVHAQAGWRLSLAETLFLSAAAKLPVLSYESTGRNTGQQLGTRYGYDFARPFRNALTWTGEVGVHLSSGTDLSLYYDQSPVSGLWSGGRQQEERIGTRIIWRFW
ncbi:MAG: hypothetical protein A2075_14135 [Geobacteraceae bacterium GWC2_58_44]|nr:MAG: hypothetical protein A2075_14135 [Geobacteraceae bacterium GWC2_58_44]HBG04308.1 hypothetical protein [Geobacter sp.]